MPYTKSSAEPYGCRPVTNAEIKTKALATRKKWNIVVSTLGSA
jgi:hypothetical protein